MARATSSTGAGTGLAPTVATVRSEPVAARGRRTGHGRLHAAWEERLALGVFVVWAVATVPLVLWVLGDHQWFFWDEWDFLADRNLTDPGDLVRPHNEHWTAIPIVVYRLIFRVVGLREYWPYQLVVVLAHVTAVSLLRVVMRRAGVGPWIATTAAGALLLFGPGDQDIVWAFQMAFTGALAFGLGHLLLADHDGDLGPRDAVGVLLGAAAVMTASGIGIVMVAAVGLAVLLRRGPRCATWHVAPVAALYVAWWLVARPEGPENPMGYGPLHVAEMVARWDVITVRATVGALGGSAWAVGWLIGVVVVVGGVLLVRDEGVSGLARRAPAPVALLAAALAFATLTGASRWYIGLERAESPRYLHIGAALALPAIAMAADAVARRHVLAEPAMVLLLLAGVPANVAAFHDDIEEQRALNEATRRSIVAMATSPSVAEVPAAAQPNLDTMAGLTVGWLRARADEGDLPDVGEIPPLLRQVTTLRLVVTQSDDPIPGTCRPLDAPVVLTPDVGTVLGVRGGRDSELEVRLVGPRGGRSIPLRFTPIWGERLTVNLADVRIELTPVGDVQLCR